ncbi:MAG: GNAT family N-acetyltransferase [Jatrophihabitantaceae bacterium]
MSRLNVRVRPAEIADVAALVELTRSVDLTTGTFSGRGLLDDSTDHLSARFATILANGERTLLVAVDEGTTELVGLLAARPDDIGAIDLTPVLHVSHLIVAAKQRRRGIGRALLAAAVHLAEDRGYDRVLATAASGSRDGNRYLARLGFAPLVVHRVASTATLRRTLGIADAPERIAVLRRARLARVQRAGFAGRVARRGA